MAQDLKALMKMDSATLAELAIKYNAPVSSSMSKKDLALEVYRAASVFESMHYQELMEEENVWINSSGIEQTYLSGQSYLQMGDINKLLPSEVASDLLANDSSASAFTYAYRNQQDILHNEIMVTLRQSGVNPDEVYGQLPVEYRSSGYIPMQRELRNVLHSFQHYVSGDNGGLDIANSFAGYYSGNDERFMNEFSTPKELGGLPLEQALNNVAGAYINRTRYDSDESYSEEVAKLARRLQVNIGYQMQGIATHIATERNLGKNTFVSYADVLPNSLSDKRLSGITGARIPDKSLMPDVRKNMRGIAAIFGYGGASTNARGQTGLVVPNKTADDVSLKDELMLLHGDEPGIIGSSGNDSRSAYSLALEEIEDYDPNSAFEVALEKHEKSEDEYVPAVSAVTKKVTSPDYRYTPDVSKSFNWSERVGRGGPSYADAVSNIPSEPPDLTGIKFYDVTQNSPEWDALRANNVTASMAGSLLGNNKYIEPDEAIFQSIGFNPLGITNIHNQHFKRGHRLEEVGRARYALEYGQEVKQVGFVTNDLYPGLGVSPDGLVGDDGLVEFKAPAANRFFDPKDKPDYIDQVQMQMAVTGRKWTDLTQVGSNYGSDGKEHYWLGRVDRINADPKWAEQNAERLQNYGSIIKEGRTLHSFMESGAVSKEEFIDIMSKAVAKGNAEGVEIIRTKIPDFGGDTPNWTGGNPLLHKQPRYDEHRAPELRSTTSGDVEQISPNYHYDSGSGGVEPGMEVALRGDAGWKNTEDRRGTFETRHDFDARDYRRKGRRAATGFEVAPSNYDYTSGGSGGNGGDWGGAGGRPNWGNPKDRSSEDEQYPARWREDEPSTGSKREPEENKGDADFDNPESWFSNWDSKKNRFNKETQDRWGKLAEAVKKGVEEAEKEKEKNKKQRQKVISDVVDGATSVLDSVLSIPAAGSVGGAKNALERAVGRIPGAGKLIAAGIGAMGVAADAVDIMGEEVGFGEEAGIFNPYMWMGNKQNFEALGMNEHQAFAAATTFGNASSQLNFGNPAAAARLLTDFRGLVGLEDLRNMKDPSAFAKLVIQRGKARGYTNQQMSGMFSAAGMPELSRALTASDSTWEGVHERSERAGAKTGEEIDNVYGLNSKLKDARAKLNTSYNVKGLVLDEAGEGKLDSLSGFVDHMSPQNDGDYKSLPDKIDHDFQIPEWQRKMTEVADLPKALFALSGVESGHGSNTVNPKSTATGQYQVLAGKNKNGTLYNPSFTGYDKLFNIQGAKDDSEPEKDRVASEYLKANIQDEGNLYAGVLAYHIGPGAMHNLRKRFGDDWNKHLTSEQADYLQKFKENFEAQYGDMIKGQEVFSKRNNLNNYAARFNNNSRDKVDINVDVNIKGSTANTVVAMNNRAVKQKTTNLNPGGQMHTVIS